MLTKTSLIVLFILTTQLSAKDVKAVEDLVISKYLGKWHEIAAIPASFQKDCRYGTTARYTNLNNDSLEVTNSCHKKDKTLKVSIGTARKDASYNLSSQLQVTFVKIFGRPVWIFGGKYWVLKLGKNYDYALVGEPGRDYAWILARDANVPKKTLESVHRELVSQGYDPCTLKMSRQRTTDFADQRPTLCEFLGVK